MFKSLIYCKKKNSLNLIWLKICQKVHGYVLKRLAKFEQNLSVGSCFTMSQSFSMKTRFVLKYTIRNYSLRSLDSEYAECVKLRTRERNRIEYSNRTPLE